MEQWQTIMDALAAAGINVYAPGEHAGICTEPYCVVLPCGGTVPEKSLRCGRADYRIYLVVPCDFPAAMDELAGSVRSAMSELVAAGTVQLTVPRSPMTADSGFSALISSIEYCCYYSERNDT